MLVREWWVLGKWVCVWEHVHTLVGGQADEPVGKVGGGGTLSCRYMDAKTQAGARTAHTHTCIHNK